MQKVLAIIRKEIALRFSSPAEWVFFLILPIFFTVVLAGGTGSQGDNRVRLVVVDQTQSPLAAELMAALGQSDAVRPEVLPLEQAEQQFSARQAAVVLIIPPTFDMQHLQQGPVELELRQQPNDLNALVAARAITSITNQVSGAVDTAAGAVAEAERIQPFASDAARADYFNEALQTAQAQMSSAFIFITVTQGATPERIDYNPRASSSAGQLITWVFVPLLGISGTFAYERQKGTLRRLLTTPTPRSIFLLGTITGQVIIALVQMLLLIGFAVLVMKLNWGRSPAGLALMMVSSALAAAALGTALGTFVKSEGQANGLSLMLGMVMALLGGCWYPIEMFPPFVQNAVKILPTSWAMQGMLNLVQRGQGLAGILPQAAVLLGFAAVFFTIGVWRLKFE